MTTRGVDSALARAPVEAALRHLGAYRYGDLVKIIEHAIRRPEDETGRILRPITESTAVLRDRTTTERAHALWRVIEEGIVHPDVSPAVQPRHLRVLRAAFRLPDEDVGEEWGASLTDRFKQLRSLRSVFGGATTTQPMEIAWKRAVERLAAYLEERFDTLRTPEDWARHLQVTPSGPRPGNGAPTFRRPSEGAQKLLVNLQILTVVMRGRVVARRISERLITSQDEGELEYFRAWAFSSSRNDLQGRSYAPTNALWGCRAEQVIEDEMPVTRLCFPRPLRTGERAHFATEVVHEKADGEDKGWANVDVDHHGIEAGELRDGVLPVRGLTIRVKFDDECLPKAVWWYAEMNERERYVEPPVGSPRRLKVVCGGVTKTFEEPCQPRESYGIAYSWFPDDARTRA